RAPTAPARSRARWGRRHWRSPFWTRTGRAGRSGGSPARHWKRFSLKRIRTRRSRTATRSWHGRIGDARSADSALAASLAAELAEPVLPALGCGAGEHRPPVSTRHRAGHLRGPQLRWRRAISDVTVRHISRN